MASQETEASSVSNFRAYLRINTVQPNPDYSKSGIIDHPIAGVIVSHSQVYTLMVSSFVYKIDDVEMMYSTI